MILSSFSCLFPSITLSYKSQKQVYKIQVKRKRNIYLRLFCNKNLISNSYLLILLTFPNIMLCVVTYVRLGIQHFYKQRIYSVCKIDKMICKDVYLATLTNLYLAPAKIHPIVDNSTSKIAKFTSILLRNDKKHPIHYL